ncbi:MAG: PAS domain S-box protein [Desulfuromonadaceae bacterium]|nr:PAS domain S-box protein [Desulfuromonadaceae bacterium]
MKYHTKINTLIAVLALLVVLVVSLTFRSFRQIETAAEARRQIASTINLAGELQSELLNAETGQRGYLLTGDESYLQPYLAVRDTIKVRLADLRQISRSSDTDKNLDALVQLIDTKLAYLAKSIELRRAGRVADTLANVRSNQSKPLMDLIRAELDSVSKKKELVLQQREADFQSKLRVLFAVIAFASLMMLLLALAFAYLIHRESGQRIKDVVHLETAKLLDIQEGVNKELQQANVSLQESAIVTEGYLSQLESSQIELEAQNTNLQRSQQELETSQIELEMQNDELREARELAAQFEAVLRDSEEHLAVTLNSIGDAVIVTNDAAQVLRLNPVAEQLTGWTAAEASGRTADEIFHIVNKETRLPAPVPVMDAILHGTTRGLTNHTVLIARDGSELDIADSCAPIRNRDNQVIGAVLVFRDVTEEYAVQQSLRDSAALMRAILNTVVDGIITIHARGALIETVNPAAEQMFGYTAEELDGQNFSMLIPELDQDQRDGSLDYYRASEEALASGHGREVMGKRKDGSYFPLELAASEMIMGGQRYFTGILRDISARKLAEEALAKAGALQSAIFNSANFSSIATDANGVIQIFNVGAERMLGYTAAEVMNKITPADISDPQEVITRAKELSIELETPIAPGFEALVFKASREIEDIYELTYIRKDGSRFPAVVSVTALRDDLGGIIGYLLIGTDNTARKQAEEALLKAGALQSAIFNSANFSSIATDANGVIQIFNVGAERMLGYTAAEVMNKITPAEISDPQEVIARAKELSIELETAIAPGFEALVFKASRGIEDIYELTYIRKDGSRFPAVVSVTALRDAQNTIIGYLLIGTDNTARKLAEEALLKAGALQSAIFNSANFSSIATDAKGVIQIFNVGAERMLGYTAVEVMNKNTPADISDPQEVVARAEALSIELETPITPGFEALVFKASRGIEDIYELTYIRKDGSRFPAVVSVTALRDAQNSIIGYLLIGTDNTARKLVEAERIRLEQVLQDKNIELERATHVAEKANLAKSDFLSSMSHELRTPLSAILGFAQLMESGAPQLTVNQKRSIDQILKAGWYLLELINEILDLALIESGKLSMSLEPVSLPEVIHECETMIEPDAIKHGISVTFTVFDVPCFIEADRTRIKQVLINLLSNAIKYNRAGGTVLVDSVLNGTDSVRISVRDTGAGLSPKQLTQLFQPFNRLGQESSGEQGTGIGLVVSKRLVELMGGVIGVESTVGEGSVFWIEMNLMARPHAPVYSTETLAAAKEHKEGDAPTQTLLYVEDNPANMMLVEDIIARRPDIRLLTARNGKSGIALARSSLPDVILMDINLPGISGIDAMKILAVDLSTAHIPVVALSANAMPRDIERGLEAGFFRYLTKPINVNVFLDTLNIALKYAKTKEPS